MLYLGLLYPVAVLLRALSRTGMQEVFHGCERNWFIGVTTMKKYLAMLGTGLASVAAFADGLTANTGSLTPDTAAITGTGGVLDTIASYINTAAEAAWPYVLGIIGVGLLIWLGRAMLRAVRAYFSTAM